MDVIDEEMAIDVASTQDDSIRSEYLVCAAQAGSSAAFAELREIYSQRVYRQILGITKNREDAEDALQDAFLRAYLALHKFEGRSSFYSWLTRIAINSALMILRKRRKRPEVSIDYPNETGDESRGTEFRYAGPSPEVICLQRQRCLRMLRSISNLQPRLRDVLELRLTHDCSVKEIAQTLEISEAAVKSRLSRARSRLTASRTFRCADGRSQSMPGSHSGSHAA
jgi:RNA polymerase sigma-70 factor (ECF subfamily)